MMNKTFSLEILTTRHTIFRGEVVSLVAPGALGCLGVWAHHAPLVTTLTAGKITARDASGAVRVLQAKGSGFLEVFKNQATVLIDEVDEGAA